MKIRILSLLLFVLMIITIIPFAVSAETLIDAQGVKYTVSADGTYCTVSHYEGDALQVVIPSEYGGLPVKGIDDVAFAGHNDLERVTIPDTVLSIGFRAFHYCMSLDNVIIPDSVTFIDEYAFSYCFGLKSLKIGGSVETIGDFAFYFCQSLPSVEIPASVTNMGTNVFDGCIALTNVYCESASQPSGWNTSWKFGCNAEVEWGHVIKRDVKGDADGDGIVDQLDYLYVKRAYFDTYTLSDAEYTRADVDDNNTVDQVDYMLIKRIYFGTYTAK